VHSDAPKLDGLVGEYGKNTIEFCFIQILAQRYRDISDCCRAKNCGRLKAI